MRKRNPWTTRWLVLSAVAALAVLAACMETTTPPTAGDPPVIVSFTADPVEIDVCNFSTLSWSVSGDDVTLALTTGASTLYEGSELTRSEDVSPTTTTTYTLTATNAAGSVDAEATVTVVGEADGPELTGLTATMLRQSRVELAWEAASCASAIEVYAAASSAPDADATPVTELSGGADGFTMPIPNSDRQTIRVCAVSGEQRSCATAELSNVVTRSDDYDPYDLQQDVPGAFWPEDPISGTLRDVLENADPGAVIGFAADVSSIVIRGVDLEQLAIGWVDAHLILRDDVTISGPTTGITLNGTSAALAVDGDTPGLDFTYRSRMVLILEGVEATFENLTISGGDFIYQGGGIRNNGTLTLVDTTVTDNRSWELGGGILNAGTLTLIRSSVVGNESFTSDAELAEGEYAIRGGDTTPMEPDGQGGGFYNVAGASLTLIDSVVEDNSARLQGGGLYLEAGSATTVEGASVIQANSAGSGGRGIHHLYFSGEQDTSLVPRLSIDYGTGNPPTNYVGVVVAIESGLSPASVTPSWTVRDR